jgi:peptidoglycan/LPS O-acetylase OafA/YrhL
VLCLWLKNKNLSTDHIKKYPSINGLRAISILLVILHHLAINHGLFNNFPVSGPLRIIGNFLQDGQMGVNVFFVISGFLITSLLMREEEAFGSISVKDFYIRRTLRVFPAFYFLLLVYAILQIAGDIKISAPSWITAITYTKYFNWKLDWYTAHAWSLSIEEHFYLVWPLVFMGGKKARKILALALVLLVPFFRLYGYVYTSEWINGLTIFTRIDAIAIGCLFAIYKDAIITRLNRHWYLFFIVSIAGLLLLQDFHAVAAAWHIPYISIMLGSTNGTIASLLIAVIMMYSVFGPRKYWYTFLNLKVMNYIGLLSYSLYLWQQPFLGVSNHWSTGFPLNIACLIVMALISYYGIEKPFLKLKSRFSAEKTSGKVASS